MLRSIVLAGGIVAFGAAGAWASPLTDKYSSFWVFGDSLSDDGNLFAATSAPPISDPTPASPPYYMGRFSNGPVWNEGIQTEFLLAEKRSDNFAFGGATAGFSDDGIPDLTEQIKRFTDSPLSSNDGDRPLASLWFGANDILDAIEAIATDPDLTANVLPTAIAAAQAVGNGARSLASVGIADFAIWNLPDIGRTPLFATAPEQVRGLVSAASNLFNLTLDSVIADLRGKGLRVTEIDTFGLFNAVLANPGTFRFTNTTTPCIIPDVSVCVDEQGRIDARGLLYFDPIHPTAAAHAILADTFVAAVPLPSTGLLLAFGLGLLALRRRAA